MAAYESPKHWVSKDHKERTLLSREKTDSYNQLWQLSNSQNIIKTNLCKGRREREAKKWTEWERTRWKGSRSLQVQFPWLWGSDEVFLVFLHIYKRLPGRVIGEIVHCLTVQQPRYNACWKLDHLKTQVPYIQRKKTFINRMNMIWTVDWIANFVPWQDYL